MTKSRTVEVNVTQSTLIGQTAQVTADGAASGVDNLNDPDLMSVIEKQTAVTQYAGLTSQYNVILARAKDDNISTTDLTTAYTNLNAFMASILTDTTKASDVNRETYKSLTDAYNIALSNVQTALGDSYNADIDNMQSSVSVASQAASSAVIVASQAATTGDNANQVASRAIVVANDAQSAGNNAISVANNASQAASDAVIAGSTASVNADKAVKVASQAQIAGNNATSVANNASQAASGAVIAGSTAAVTGNQASTAASDASVQASVAVSKANVAQSSAMAAVNQAGFASDTSVQASQAASSAVASAMSAESNASSAVSIANSTASGFGKVSQKADSAVASALSAESDASAAVTQATSAVADSKDAKQIAGAVSQSYKTLTDGSTMTIAELENGLAAKLTKTDLDGYATQTWTQNKIKVTADDISGNLSSVKKTVDGQTTSINDLKADSSGFKTQFTTVNDTLGKHTTDISTLQTDSSGFKTQFQTVNDNVGKNATDIGTLQASSKELTTGFNTLTADNGTNKNDISQLKQTSKEVNSTLETVQTQVQNSAVGTNLLLGTKYFDNLSSWADNSNWNIITDTYNGFSIVQANQDWSGLSQYNQVSAGETYTFSMYARYVSGTGTSTFYTILNNNPENGHTAANTSPNSSNVSLTSDWQRVSITFTITSDGWIKPRIERTNNNTNTLQICGMKLEKGSLATDWCPNPADNATVTALMQVKQTADGAQVLATNNKGDITSIQETAKGLQSSINSKASSDQLTQLSDQLTNQITTASNDASSEMIQTINNASIGFENADGTSYSINLSADGTALMDVSKLIINGQTSIMDATIGTAQIADLAVTNAQIGNEAVGTAQIADLAVGTAQIGDGAITNAKIGKLAVGTAQIANGAITDAQIGSLAVGTAQIKDAAISSAKIADLAVGTAQIGDGAITNAKIGKLAVGTAQIANAAITDAQIGNVSANKLTAGTIDFNTITGKNINASNITTGTLDTNRLNVNKLSALSANLGDVTTGSLKGVDIVANTFSTPNGSFTTDSNGAITAKSMSLTDGKVSSSTISASTINGSTINGATFHGGSVINNSNNTAGYYPMSIDSLGTYNSTYIDDMVALRASTQSGAITYSRRSMSATSGHYSYYNTVIGGQGVTVSSGYTTTKDTTFDAAQTPTAYIGLTTSGGLFLHGSDANIDFGGHLSDSETETGMYMNPYGNIIGKSRSDYWQISKQGTDNTGGGPTARFGLDPGGKGTINFYRPLFVDEIGGFTDSNGNALFIHGKDDGKSGSTGQMLFRKDGRSAQVVSASIYNRTYSGGSNVTVTSYGTLGRITSASKYKLDITKETSLTPANNLLSIDRSSWVDKSSAEQLSDSKTNGTELSEPEINVNRHYGLIAEDLIKAGLDEFVIKGDNGQAEGIEYDRLWTVLIPKIRQLSNNQIQNRMAIAKLESEIEELKQGR